MKEEKINTGTRIGSMIIDHFAMTFLAMILFIPEMVSEFSSAFEINHEPANLNMFSNMSYVGLIGFALYFCKDSINGRSIGKRALNLQVVENSSGKAASSLRCFVRNIFCVIWPIEVIVALVNPNRRIGDRIAGTKVIPFNPELEQPKINFGQIGLSVALSYGLLLLFMLPFEGLKAKVNKQQVHYMPSTLNVNAATETTQLFADSLGSFMIADVKVYDQLKDNKDLKYVSVILKLNKNYLENQEDFEELKSITIPLLLSKFPAETFVGQIKYVYQQQGSLQSTTLPLDWRIKE